MNNTTKTTQEEEMWRSGERSVVLLGFLAALCLLGSGNAQRLPKGFANPIDRYVRKKFIFIYS
jgi:hypothetical protein